METRPDFPLGHEPRAATDTGPVPVVPATPNPLEQPTTWRSNIGVVIALVVAMTVIALVSI